ncbi:MAG: hypothetical protein ACM3P1_05970 [Candidatus Saccharibacteria bacterium]
MRYITPLTYGDFFHIYNRGADRCDIFKSVDTYKRFLALYDEYISPVADTYAWVLMRNHFHLLVRIKMKEEIGFIQPNPKRGSVSSGRNQYQYKSAIITNTEQELKKVHSITPVFPTFQCLRLGFQHNLSTYGKSIRSSF